MIRIIYFGTADYAVPALEALLAAPDRFEVAAVVSRADKPAGRKGDIAVAPVAKLARERKLTLYQPAKLKDDEFYAALSALAPDVLVVASYGRIIPRRILDLPKVAPLNLHGSLLPAYRGASPIQSAILEGERVTGTSLMVMDEEIDHGPVIATIETPIADDDTHESLEKKMGSDAARLLADNLEPFVRGDIKAVPQDHAAATFTKILSREDGLVDWRAEDAERIERKTRAYHPWPGAYFIWTRPGTSGAAPMRVKILKASVIAAGSEVPPGTAFVAPSGMPAVVAAKDVLVLDEVQPEGKKPMPGKAFLNGHKDFAGSTL